MYMYYLLGFKLFGSYEADRMLLEEMEGESCVSKVRHRKKNKGKKKERSRPLKSLFTRMNAEQYDQVRICQFIHGLLETANNKINYT